MSLPLVSIVTPSYNQAQFIESTICSVLEQDYPQLEYIICDGGSTDGSVDIIRNYENRLAYWVSEKDRGQTDAINRGLQHTSGQILAYINSDDQYEPGAISRVVQFFDRYPQISIIYGNYRLIDESGKVIYTVETPDFDLKKFFRRNFICQPTVFWRASVNQGIGEYDSSLHYIMDYEFYLRAAIYGFQFAKIPGSPLARFRMWEGTKTSVKSDSGLQEDWAVLQRFFDSGKLPKELSGMKEEALANACIVIAIGQFQAGAMGEARRFLRKAVGTHWPVVFKSELIPLYGKTLVGEKLSRRIRAFRRSIQQTLFLP